MNTFGKVAIGAAIGAVAAWFGAKYYYGTKYDKILQAEMDKLHAEYDELSDKCQKAIDDANDTLEKVHNESTVEIDESEDTEFDEDCYKEYHKLVDQYNSIIAKTGKGTTYEKEQINLAECDDGEYVVETSANDDICYDPTVLEAVDCEIVKSDMCDGCVDCMTLYKTGELVDDTDDEHVISFLERQFRFGPYAETFKDYFGTDPDDPYVVVIHNLYNNHFYYVQYDDEAYSYEE